jgi:hypothetical protein
MYPGTAFTRSIGDAGGLLQLYLSLPFVVPVWSFCLCLCVCGYTWEWLYGYQIQFSGFSAVVPNGMYPCTALTRSFVDAGMLQCFCLY